MRDAQKGTGTQPATQAARALTEGRKELEKGSGYHDNKKWKRSKEYRRTGTELKRLEIR
jgi:hypothetical protein